MAVGGIHFRRSGFHLWGPPPGRSRVGNDGAGVPRGLAQAGASGVKVARAISKRL